MVEFRHPIQVVARLTGLSQHVIRVWEKRYGAVVPERTGTNRRLYSDEDVERLTLLSRATESGHKISIIARLGVEDLRRLVATVSREIRTAPEVSEGSNGHANGGNGASAHEDDATADAIPEGGRWVGAGAMPVGGIHGFETGGDAGLVAEAVAATSRFQGEALVRVLETAVVRFGHNGMLHRVVCPLAREVGERWQRGEVTAAHEHFASGIIRDFVARTSRPYPLGEGAPCAVVTTPAGQLHELGAVIVAAAAANLGWRVIYLGASLPAAEIAGAVGQNHARALLLSIVYPSDDPRLPEELGLMRRLMPAGVEILAGGRAAPAYAAALKQVGAILPGDIEEMGELLDELRTPKSES